MLAIGQNFALVLQVLAIGFIVWLVYTYAPVPSLFKRVVYFIAAVVVLVLLYHFLKREVPELFAW